MKYNTNIIYIKRKLGGGDVMKHKYNLPKFLHANLPEGVKPFFYGLAGRTSLLCCGAVCQLEGKAVTNPHDLFRGRPGTFEDGAL